MGGAAGCRCGIALIKIKDKINVDSTHLKKNWKSSHRVSQPGHLHKLCRYSTVSGGTSDNNNDEDNDDDDDDPLLLLLLLLS